MADYKPPAGFEEINPGYHDFETNPVLQGVLIEKESDVGDNNSMRYTIENIETHEQEMVWGSTVLDARMKTADLGIELVLWYQGKKPSTKRGGKDYHDWKVYKNTTASKGATAKDLEEVFGEDD